MPLDQPEEFFGPNRVTQQHRQNARVAYFAIVPFGIFFSLMWFMAPPGSRDTIMAFAFLLSPVIGLFIIGYGIRTGLASSREAAMPRPDSVWYVLNDEGVQFPDTPTVDRFMPWLGMQKVESIGGSPPKVVMTGRPPGAAIDRTFKLRADIRGKDGASFGDRIKAWFDAKASSARR